jgi:putative tryptophan/tyrosine transport system substrate-binding protein
LGYVEGSTIAIEWRFAEGKLNRLLALAGDLVRLNVDVIVTGGSGSNPHRQGSDQDNSYRYGEGQRSGRGRFYRHTCASRRKHNRSDQCFFGLSGKRLELLRDTIPKLFRVAVLGNSTNPANAQALKETENAAQALGLKLEYLDMPKADELRAYSTRWAKHNLRLS